MLTVTMSGGNRANNSGRNGFCDMAEMLIEAGANVESETIYGRTALMDAVVHIGAKLYNYYSTKGPTSIIKMLLTPRHLLLRLHNRREIAQLLLDKGADVNAFVFGGKTAVMFAAEKGNVDVINELIERGAGVDAADEYGKTALMFDGQKREGGLCQSIDRRWC